MFQFLEQIHCDRFRPPTMAPYPSYKNYLANSYNHVMLSFYPLYKRVHELRSWVGKLRVTSNTSMHCNWPAMAS